VSALHASVLAIRAVEDAAGTPHHIVTVQGPASGRAI